MTSTLLRPTIDTSGSVPTTRQRTLGARLAIAWRDILEAREAAGAAQHASPATRSRIGASFAESARTH